MSNWFIRSSAEVIFLRTAFKEHASSRNWKSVFGLITDACVAIISEEGESRFSFMLVIQFKYTGVLEVASNDCECFGFVINQSDTQICEWALRRNSL